MLHILHVVHGSAFRYISVVKAICLEHVYVMDTWGHKIKGFLEGVL